MQDDYLAINARIKVLENGLLGKKEYDRLCECRTREECASLLSGCGWSECDPFDAISLERAADMRRARYFELLERWSPSSAGMRLCRVQYDLHNFKSLYKAEVLKRDARALLSKQGAFTEEEIRALPEFRQCVELLLEKGDPTLSDAVADRWAVALMEKLARGVQYLESYVRLYIDGCNYKLLRRALAAGKDEGFVKERFLEGGGTNSFSYEKYPFDHSLEPDRAVEEKLGEYSKQGRRDVFGDRCVPAFALAVENEISRVRRICALARQGLAPAEIKQRLGESYV